MGKFILCSGRALLGRADACTGLRRMLAGARGAATASTHAVQTAGERRAPNLMPVSATIAGTANTQGKLAGQHAIESQLSCS